MNKYQLVEKKSEEPAKQNEIRVTSNNNVYKQINNDIRILQKEEDKTLVIRAMGQAIHKAVQRAEIIKRNLAGLHQLTEIVSVPVIDVYEPIEEGLDRVQLKRDVSCISITLSLNSLDVSHKGYQPPISQEIIDQYAAYRRPQNPSKANDLVEHSPNDNKPRGRGRGRGRFPYRGKERRSGQRNSSRFNQNNVNKSNSQDEKVVETNKQQTTKRNNSQNQENSSFRNQDNQRQPRNQNNQRRTRYSNGPSNQDNQGGQRYSNDQRNQDYQPRERYQNGSRNYDNQGGQRYSGGQRNQNYQGNRRYSNELRNEDNQGRERYQNGSKNRDYQPRERYQNEPRNQGGQRYSSGQRNQGGQYHQPRREGSQRNRVNSGRPPRGTFQTKQSNNLMIIEPINKDLSVATSQNWGN